MDETKQKPKEIVITHFGESLHPYEDTQRELETEEEALQTQPVLSASLHYREDRKRDTAQPSQLEKKIAQLEKENVDLRRRAGEAEAEAAETRYSIEERLDELTNRYETRLLEYADEVKELKDSWAQTQQEHERELRVTREFYEEQMATVHNNIRRLLVWQVERTGAEKRVIVAAANAADAAQRVLAVSPETDSDRVAGIRLLHDKLVI